jgi:hypothetical protein
MMNELVQMKPMMPEDWDRILLEPIDQVLDEEGAEYVRGHNVGGKPFDFAALRTQRFMDVIDDIDPSYDLVFLNWPSNIFAGQVLVASDKFVAQDIGDKHAKVHATKDLDMVPAVGDVIRVTYVNDVGLVEHIKAS